MADHEVKTAAPMCRAQNPELDVVKRFLYAMPHTSMAKRDFDQITESKFHGWTSTHYQMAKQMALYYAKDDVCYPRFQRNISMDEILKYLGDWATKYYAPNPFTKDLSKYDEAKPTVLYAYFADCIRKGKTSYQDACENLFGNIQLNNMDKVKLMLNSFTNIYIDSSGNMSFQGWSAINVPSIEPDIENPLDEESFFNYFGTESKGDNMGNDNNDTGYNKIFYGAPGTGKSHTVEEDYVKGHKSFRITFHPDTDYASFVGCYKPSMGGEDEDQITYAFVPQVFLNAYEYSWNHPGEKTYLVIEELNRGNCAQIFGDVFQLLDRRIDDYPGFSKYKINADTDIAKHLKKHITNGDGSYENKIKEIYGLKEFDFSIMALPDNLYILATMNTSDQSLFPIDSAFKRRWEWEYVKVNYPDATQFTLKIDDKHKYNWGDVLLGLNNYIKGETHNTNKILGNRFVQAGADKTISAKSFRDKVLFFLFNDVFKDDDDFKTAFFGDNAEDKFFEDLCVSNDTELTIKFIENICGAKNIAPAETPAEETTETTAE